MMPLYYSKCCLFAERNAGGGDKELRVTAHRPAESADVSAAGQSATAEQHGDSADPVQHAAVTVCQRTG